MRNLTKHYFGIDPAHCQEPPHPTGLSISKRRLFTLLSQQHIKRSCFQHFNVLLHVMEYRVQCLLHFNVTALYNTAIEIK